MPWPKWLNWLWFYQKETDFDFNTKIQKKKSFPLWGHLLFTRQQCNQECDVNGLKFLISDAPYKIRWDKSKLWLLKLMGKIFMYCLFYLGSEAIMTDSIRSVFAKYKLLPSGHKYIQPRFRTSRFRNSLSLQQLSYLIVLLLIIITTIIRIIWLFFP